LSCRRFAGKSPGTAPKFAGRHLSRRRRIRLNIGGHRGREYLHTVWDEPFATEQEALDAVMEVIEQDVIKSFLHGGTEAMH
jgi:hypothetical protein